MKQKRIGKKGGRRAERNGRGLLSSRHWKGGESDRCDGCKDGVR